MTSLKIFATTGVAALFVAVQGCGYYSSKPNDGPGVTEADVKKIMDEAQSADKGPTKPAVVEFNAEEMMEGLTFPMAASSIRSALAGGRRRVTGKVLELNPAESESLFVILDGGTHQGKAYRVKCTFAADQGAALKQVKAGDKIHIEGTSDGIVNDATLEFKDCVQSAESDAEPEAGTEKSPSPKP